VHSGSSGVTLRENTERPETVNVGANVLAGVSSIEMLKATRQMISQGDGWKNPFGDGKASNLILDLLKIL
jgi:UDP-N-acetylglucosamine 2-epimerase (non-hydrolysing)